MSVESRGPASPFAVLRQRPTKLTLHLGVLIQPYAYGGKKAPVTTGDVAGWLENRYHIMGVFAKVNEKLIADYVVNSMQGSLETLLMAGRIVDPWGAATQAIQTRFRYFISSRQVEGLGIPGVPTFAALQGHSHRFKHPYRKRARRPSFRDTGLYMDSFRAWVD